MFKAFIKKYIPTFALISLAVTLVSLGISVAAVYLTSLADFINSTVATALRVVMEALTHLLPFSLFELILMLLLPAVAFVIFLIVRDKRGWVARVRTIFALLGVVGIIYSGYLLVMAVSYRTTPLSTHLSLADRQELTKEELYAVTEHLVEEVAALEGQLTRGEDGVSHRGYDLARLSEIISDSYESVRREYPFFHNFETSAKPIRNSSIMSDMGITGIYTYFTGESNINVEYPDYAVTFVVAHEFAHQRGIMRENEANFMAFLATTSADDPYVRYSGYLYMYIYLSNALWGVDKELALSLRDRLPEGALCDLRRSSEITAMHLESPLNKFFESLNNSYLQSNGTPGVVSYSYVVRIAVAYYDKLGIIP